MPSLKFQRILLCVLVAVGFVVWSAGLAMTSGWELGAQSAHNMRLVGYNDLQGQRWPRRIGQEKRVGK